jgi:hypothetical protein
MDDDRVLETSLEVLGYGRLAAVGRSTDMREQKRREVRLALDLFVEGIERSRKAYPTPMRTTRWLDILRRDRRILKKSRQRGGKVDVGDRTNAKEIASFIRNFCT